MKASHFVLCVGLLLPLSACSSLRQSTPLAYAGDGRATVAPLESTIQKRGYKPVCKSREFCKFAYNEQVWVHFKASEKKVVMAVDVTDGTKMPIARAQALTDEASKVGQAIWEEASRDARAQEQAAAEQKAAEKAAVAAAEKEKKAQEPSSSSGNSAAGVLTGILSAVSQPPASGGIGVTGGVTSSASSSATCCINHAFYDCPSAAAVKKCSGDTSACLMKCMNSSDMSCGDHCMRDYPPDPSGCSRQSNRDGECH